MIAALAPGLGVLILGYSGFEGVGSALMIPPIYILTTLLYDDMHVTGKGIRDHQWDGRRSAPPPGRWSAA